jgi:hypothetical protein
LHGAAKAFAAHQFDVDPVAFCDSRQLGLFKITADIKRLG